MQATISVLICMAFLYYKSVTTFSTVSYEKFFEQGLYVLCKTNSNMKVLNFGYFANVKEGISSLEVFGFRVAGPIWQDFFII
jgi:hypothetical protein